MSSVLAELTTLRVGGPASDVCVADTETAVIDAVRAADAERRELLVLGEGSNVVCSDAPFPGTVLRIANRGIVRTDDDHGTFASVQAGEPWDAFVAWSLAEGLTGLEALSGIPGLVGAAPVQNVGAYGQETSNLLTHVVAWDRVAQTVMHMTAADCEFGYRSSAFKRQPDRWIILDVTFRLEEGTPSPVRYAELADRLGVALGEGAPASDVREAVLELRRAKGMVLDSADHDTWSVGSFFTNPIVDPARDIPAECPRYPAQSGMKVSAAWLIGSAGIERGWGLNERARISTKHVLALTNRGGATAADILELASSVRERVHSVHGVVLEVEPRLIGCAL